MKKIKITKLWEGAGKKLQIHYRTLGLLCCGCGKPQTVMHHYRNWAGSIPLRLEKVNLIPFCRECHCSWHGNRPLVLEIKAKEYMENKYGHDWLEKLSQIEQSWIKKGAPELRDYINKITNYVT